MFMADCGVRWEASEIPFPTHHTKLDEGICTMTSVRKKRSRAIPPLMVVGLAVSAIFCHSSAGEPRFDRVGKTIEGEELATAVSDQRDVALRDCVVTGITKLRARRRQTSAKIEIRSTEFQGPVMFGDVEFFSEVLFDSVTFHGPVSFAEALFKERFEIHEAMFTDEVSFRDCEFRREVLCSSVVFPFRADFSRTVFDSASFRYCRLRRAVFKNTHLARVDFVGSELGDALFEPHSVPSSAGIATAKGLESLRYLQDPSALTELRNRLRRDGYREEERGVTYALRVSDNRRRASEGRRFWYFLELVLFDWTCRYGMDYGRPVVLAFWLWLLCTFIYLLMMNFGKRTAIMKEYKNASSANTQLTLNVADLSARSSKWAVGLEFLGQETKLLAWAAFFSLMSAFNIGFRGFNFGRWLRLLLPRELDLKSVGWTRTVSGIQALLSVYFFALFLLTYFERLFE